MDIERKARRGLSESDDLVCGTPGYFAPEILAGKDLTTKSDIFSLGAVFFKVITGKSLFCGEDRKTILNNNKRCTFVRSILTDLKPYSKDLQELMFSLLCKHPQSRPSAEEALNSGFFSPLQKQI